MNRTNCPACGQKLRYPDEAAHKKFRCRACGHSFRVPSRELPEEVVLVPIEPPNPFAVAEPSIVPAVAPADESPPTDRTYRYTRDDMKEPFAVVGSIIGAIAAGIGGLSFSIFVLDGVLAGGIAILSGSVGWLIGYLIGGYVAAPICWAIIYGNRSYIDCKY